jgi:hypothetical protein
MSLNVSSNTSTSGSLQLNIPSATPAGTYTFTLNATDSLLVSGTATSFTVTINKATPTVVLSLPGAATTATYGTPVLITATTSTAGNVLFKDGTTTICSSVATSSSIATCLWIPSSVGSHTLNATLTPTDSSDYNSGTATGLGVTVGQAAALTITANTPSAVTYGSGFTITNGFTTSGLVSIDTITSMTYTYGGTANDGTTYSSTTAPTKAGTYTITPSAAVFSSGAASNYVSVNYTAGSLTINRATNSSTLSYPNSNTIYYTPTGTDTATSTTLGDGTKSFTTSSTSICSVNSGSGLVSVSMPGSCVVVMNVSQGSNYLADQVTTTLSVNYGLRTLTLTPTTLSLKYGDTTTVTPALSYGSSDGLISYSSGSSNACTFNGSTGVLTATAGSGTCTLGASVSQGTYYQAATASTLTFTISVANAPVITTLAVANLPYRYGSAPTLSYSITGLKFSDSASGVTFLYSGSGSTTYASSATAPTNGGSYLITPSALTLGVGLLSNYAAPSYVATSWSITPIAQAPLYISGVYGSANVPFTLVTQGGSSTGAVTFTLTAGGSASGCSISGAVLTTSSTGTCLVYATQAADQNYLVAISPTVTVTVLNYINNTYVATAPAAGSVGIAISGGGTQLTNAGTANNAVSCTSGCAPAITSITDNGAAPSAVVNGDQLILTGSGFTGTTSVVLGARPGVNLTFQVDSDTQITAQVPTGLTPGATSIQVRSPGGYSARYAITIGSNTI